MKTDPPKPKFVYVTYIQTTPEKLWRALTTTSFIRQYWVGRENTSTWKRGAVLESRSPEGELEWHGKILESKPPHRLVYTFGGPGEPSSRVTFAIERLSRKTHLQGAGVLMLTVTHENFPPGRAGRETFRGVSEGWPGILSGLKTLLETGRPLKVIHAN